MGDFSLRIVEWYRQNKRELPWREIKDPYFIWLSEIILQQTRVDQGFEYYQKFVQHYPSIFHLANASEVDVLNDWQGLGYYSRARNLHFTAKYIAQELNGIFPNNYAELLKLKGVGEYTAAAIASFAFNLPHAVLDGNVFRVLSRVFDIDTAINSSSGKKEFSELVHKLLPEQNSDIHNQAIMEFGALHCLPKNPKCESCILQINCLAFSNKTIQLRPVKEGKIKIRKRYFYYFLIEDAGKIIISKRLYQDIWKHLYEFPLFEAEKELDEIEIIELLRSRYDLPLQKLYKNRKHVLSHQHIFATFIYLKTANLNKYLAVESDVIIEFSAISDYPLPRLIDRFLNDVK